MQETPVIVSSQYVKGQSRSHKQYLQGSHDFKKNSSSYREDINCDHCVGNFYYKIVGLASVRSLTHCPRRNPVQSSTSKPIGWIHWNIHESRIYCGHSVKELI